MNVINREPKRAYKLWIICCIVALFIIGCKNKRKGASQLPPGVSAISGPAFLRGTIGSYAELHGYEAIHVSGYGLVVGLKQTGSSTTPADLQEMMLDLMRRRGIGDSKLGAGHLSAIKMLKSTSTAVVEIHGLVPAGAVRGTPFDVMVSAIDEETTSLLGGKLLTAELSPNGVDLSIRFEKKIAIASGDLYVNPMDDRRKLKTNFQREAVIVSGGVSTVQSDVNLILNRESNKMARRIANRIIDKFGDEHLDDKEIAQAKTSRRIKINIPKRYKRHPEKLLQLIDKLYLISDLRVVEHRAQLLGIDLEKDPSYATDVTLAWQGLGKLALQVIRRYYEHEDLRVRLAALEAGAKLHDAFAIKFLKYLVETGDHKMRIGVSRLLAQLMDHRQSRPVLSQLANDPDDRVRIAVYEAMADSQHPQSVMTTRQIRGQTGRIKFELHLIPSDRPMIYVSHHRIPRIAIFGQDVGFVNAWPLTLWDNRLILKLALQLIVDEKTGKAKPAQQLAMHVFYRGGRHNGRKPAVCYPFVSHLIWVLGSDEPISPVRDGYNLSFDEIVNALYLMKKKKYIDAEFKIASSDFVQMIERLKKKRGRKGRQEIKTDGTE